MRVVVGILLLAVTLMAADFIGTWKLNLDKSKLQANDFANVASETLKISQTGANEFTTTFDTVSRAGQKGHFEAKRTYDGKEYPVTNAGNKQQGMTEICQQVDAMTRKITQKKDGKVVGEFTSTVSPDGKVMTNRFTTGTVLVFEKQ